MIFSTDPEIEKRKLLYTDWKTEGIPIQHSCEQCTSRTMRIHFLEDDEHQFRVICTQCGHHLGTWA